jgi:hypothetical protein
MIEKIMSPATAAPAAGASRDHHAGDVGVRARDDRDVERYGPSSPTVTNSRACKLAAMRGVSGVGGSATGTAIASAVGSMTDPERT